MTYETIKIEAKDAGTVHMLVGAVTDVDRDNNKVDVNIDEHGSFADIPVFYHCENSETADGMPFVGGERVIIVNSGDAVNLSVADMKVIGFEDGLPRECPVETVYVSMLVGATQRCFVWDASNNTYAPVNKNDGNPASFPCDPADISDWMSKQTSAGSGLFTASNCGRNPFYAPELSCPTGEWGTAGSSSDSVEVPSDCGCDFIDTGECSTTWNLANKCFWWPGQSHWIWSGATTITNTQHVLWRAGGQAKKLVFQNNSEVESAFRVELQSDSCYLRWDAESSACGGEPCDNIRLDSDVFSVTYKFHTPIELNILEINHARTRNWDICNDLGGYAEEGYLVDHKLSQQGSYSDKIIAQIYTVEARTLTRNRNGDITDTGYCSGDCTWISEVYTASGLKIAAQVGTFEDTDGIDPTGLSRNTSFESSITGMYNTLRTLESIADDNIANAGINMTIYLG